MSQSVRRLVFISLLIAMSYALMFALQIPLVPVAPYLKYDPSDVPTLVGSFVFGPVAGVTIAFVKAALFLITKGDSGPVGAMQNFVASGTFALVAGLIYRRFSTKWGVLAGLMAGGLAMTSVMIPVNYYWALGAYGIPQAAHLELVRTAITPFNLARSAMSTVLTFPVFLALKKPLGKIVNQK
ncbi:MAG TPA: ECF transporter S component [Bacillota bacterium]|nr:ECF transporter S component [Bacillota bacterium]